MNYDHPIPLARFFATKTDLNQDEASLIPRAEHDAGSLDDAEPRRILGKGEGTEHPILLFARTSFKHS